MRFKKGVRFKNLKPQTLLAMLIVDEIYKRLGLELVVTSVNDGKHSDLSLHYQGYAFDGRTKYPELDGKEQELRDEVQEALGSDFDVVIEAIGTDNEHIHIEYDPDG